MAVAKSVAGVETAPIQFTASPTARERIDAVLALVNEWLQDESGYDERVWPIVKQTLDESRSHPDG